LGLSKLYSVNHLIKTYIPEYFVYRPNQKGMFFPKVSSENNNKTIVKTVKKATGLVSNTTFFKQRLIILKQLQPT
jgi:hypothetical protein